jgi:hypothetical protein
MTFQELTTPANLIWPPVIYTVIVAGFTVLSRKLKRIDAPLQSGHILRIFIQGVILEAIVLVVIFIDPDLLDF